MKYIILSKFDLSKAMGTGGTDQEGSQALCMPLFMTVSITYLQLAFFSTSDGKYSVTPITGDRDG